MARTITKTGNSRRSGGRTADPSSAQKTPLALSMSELTLFSKGLITLAEIAPERMSASQLVFFLLAGLADVRNSPTTFTEIKEGVGAAIGRSLHTTYKVFLTEDELSSRSRQQALGWLYSESDRNDRRRKYLRLTSEGARAMNALLATLQGRTA